MSNLTVLFFVLSAVLLLVSVALRERDVPDTGAIGRKPSAHIVSVALAVCVATAAAMTFVRLIALAG
ncbi:conserved exported hypothetical protein [Rhodococcus sp. RD6.2]|jgi:hypothetical protein|uniref:hypothetical protein n=1 Tax=Rhodococcus sp. RD6.2 TaxID=260936 RepID=UPI00063B6C29|nr:hypothetical protein [Rhodococcus sp. RD6.2]CRK49620.1 conserved exported hypothetical protein [Rhodococcus sp. RD6.2]